MTLIAQQPKGRCVWGLESRSRSVGSCFVEKSVRRFVPLICWGFLAALVGGGGGGGVATPRRSKTLRFCPKLAPKTPDFFCLHTVGGKFLFLPHVCILKMLGIL